jgi:hypothetical protein
VALRQLLAELVHLSIPIPIKLSVPRRSGQLIQDWEVLPTHPGLGAHYPHYTAASCYFGKRLVISPRSLLFPIPSYMPVSKVPFHPKWSHLCHFPPYNYNTTKLDYIVRKQQDHWGYRNLVYETYLMFSFKCTIHCFSNAVAGVQTTHDALSCPLSLLKQAFIVQVMFGSWQFSEASAKPDLIWPNMVF